MKYIFANNVSGEIYYVGMDANADFLDIENTELHPGFHFYSNTSFNDIVTCWWDQENYTIVPKQNFNLTYSHPHTTHDAFEEIDFGPVSIGRTLDETVYRPVVDEEANTVIETEFSVSELNDVITYFPPIDKIEISGTQDITISGIPNEPYTVVTLGSSPVSAESGEITFSSSNNHTITITSPKYITKTIEIVDEVWYANTR